MAVATVVARMTVADSATAAVACSASNQTTEQRAKSKSMAVGIVPRRHPNLLFRQSTRAAVEMRGAFREDECRCPGRGVPRRRA